MGKVCELYEEDESGVWFSCFSTRKGCTSIDTYWARKNTIVFYLCEENLYRINAFMGIFWNWLKLDLFRSIKSVENFRSKNHRLIVSLYMCFYAQTTHIWQFQRRNRFRFRFDLSEWIDFFGCNGLEICVYRHKAKMCLCVSSKVRWVYKTVNKTKLPENRITYRLYLGGMPSTFLVPCLLGIRTHRSHVLAKILFAMSNSPNRRIVSPVKKSCQNK